MVGEYSEDERGVSGADPDAPELRRIMDLAHAGDFDVLVAREMDRLARSLAKQMIVQDTLERVGVEIDYVLADYDDTPEGQLQRNVRAVVAEFERLKIAERMERGRANAARAGNVLTGFAPPFGWRKAEVDGKRTLVHDPEESKWVRQIFRWYVEGDGDDARLSLYAIAQRMSERHVLTQVDKYNYEGLQKKARRGEWSPSGVRKVLRNSVHSGAWVYETRHGEQIAVAVEPLIDQATFKAAQKRLAENKRMARRKAKREYLLRSRVFCGICGRNMVGFFSHPNPYYTCSGPRRGDCTARQVRQDKLNPRVWELIVEMFSSKERLMLAYRRSLDPRLDSIDQDRLDVANNQIKRLDTRLMRLRDVYLDGDMTRKEYQAERGRLRADREKWSDIVDSLASFPESVIEPTTLTEFVDLVVSEFRNITDEKRRRWLVDRLNIEVIVQPNRRALVTAFGIRLGEIAVD